MYAADSSSHRWLSTALVLLSIILRQVLVTLLRKSGRNQAVHPHDEISLIPLSITALSSCLALAGVAPSLHVSLDSDTHIGICLAPQMLTWFYCLKNRNEISYKRFTAHALALTLCFVLLLIASKQAAFGNGLALLLCICALVMSANARMPRPLLLWFVLAVFSAQRTYAMFPSTALLTAWGEIFMMFAVKFRCHAFHQTRLFAQCDGAAAAASSGINSNAGVTGEEKRSKSSADLEDEDDILAELGLGITSASPPTAAGMYVPPSPPLLSRSSSQNSQQQLGLFPTFHHRRDVSIQSNSSWGWGPIVLDFAKNASPRDSDSGSSSSEDDEEDVDNTVHGDARQGLEDEEDVDAVAMQSRIILV